MDVKISDVVICSTALLELGSRPINSFNEDNDGARLCANMYGPIRDDMLRQHPWNFAKARRQISPEKEKPEFDFANKFRLPADFIRLIEINGLHEMQGVGFPPGYAMESGFILADVNLINMRYVYRNDIPSTWDSAFIRVMVTAMKKQLAYAITRDMNAANAATQEWAIALKLAKQTNGIEIPPQQIDGQAFIEARY